MINEVSRECNYLMYGWIGNDWRESPLLNREEEEECWDNELEPTSDWSNEQQKQPFSK